MKSTSGAFIAGLLLSSSVSVRAATVEWVRQLGTSNFDQSSAVSTDSQRNIYISGNTDGNLGGANAGFRDAVLSKFNAAGGVVWTRQLGTTDNESSSGVSADGFGNVYISGSTSGSLGDVNAGNVDAFLSKYDAAGQLLWTRQLGTPRDDHGGAVSADGVGNVYISGDTGAMWGDTSSGRADAFLSKYDAAGVFIWTRQLGTASTDENISVSTDGIGSVYIAGETWDSLGGSHIGSADVFVGKYNVDGNLLWTRQLGTTSHEGNVAIAADSLGNVYIAGATDGSLGSPNAGDYDAFLSKFDAFGNLHWTRQFGTTGKDIGHAVSVDGIGNVYLSGHLNAGLGGVGGDAFVSKYDEAGNPIWLRQLATPSTDVSLGVSSDQSGSVYVSGFTLGSLGGPHVGRRDIFVAKISDLTVPEHGTFVLAILAFIGLAMFNRHRPLI